MAGEGRGGVEVSKIALRHLWTLAFGTYYSNTLSLMSTYLTKQTYIPKNVYEISKGPSPSNDHSYSTKQDVRSTNSTFNYNLFALFKDVFYSVFQGFGLM